MDMASAGAIGREGRILNLTDIYGKERGEDLLNGPKSFSLDEKDEAIGALEEAFRNNSFMLYEGPERLLAPIRDEFMLVLDLRQ